MIKQVQRQQKEEQASHEADLKTPKNVLPACTHEPNHDKDSDSY